MPAAESSEKAHILQVGPLLSTVETLLEDAYTVHRYFEAADQDALIRDFGGQIRAVATDGHYGCPVALLDQMPNAKMIASYGVGYDAIDIPACKARGVRVSNTPDVLNDAVAELTIGMMVGFCRRIHQADQFVRRGDWAKGGFGLTAELTGKHAGILGLGRIGKEIARRLQAMKMQVSYHGRARQTDAPYEYFPQLVDMARAVDWLIVIAPGTAATRGIVSREVLTALGPEGVLVNMARGGLIDEEAMVEMLRSGALGGAALDVFVDEPGSAPKFIDLPNTLLSPHQGSATHKTRAAMGDLVVRNLAAFFAGDPLLTPVA